MALQTAKNEYHSIEPSYEPAPTIDTLKQKYDELTSFDSPSKIFYDMDTLFLLYGSIKREYNYAYKNLNHHKKKISSMLKSEKQSNVITLSAQEISRAISNMNNIQIKLNEWLQTISVKTMTILQNKSVENKNNFEYEESNDLISQSVPVSPVSPLERQNTQPTLSLHKKQNNLPTINNIQYTQSNKMFTRNILRSKYKSRTSHLNKHKKRKKRKKKLLFDVSGIQNIQPSHTKKASESFVTVNKDENAMISGQNKSKTRQRANTNNVYSMSSQLTKSAKKSSSVTGS